MENAATAVVQAIVRDMKALKSDPKKLFGVSIRELDKGKGFVVANKGLSPEGAERLGLRLLPNEINREALERLQRYLCPVDVTPDTPLAKESEASYVKALTEAFAEVQAELVALVRSESGSTFGALLHMKVARENLSKDQDEIERIGPSLIAKMRKARKKARDARPQ